MPPAAAAWVAAAIGWEAPTAVTLAGSAACGAVAFTLTALAWPAIRPTGLQRPAGATEAAVSSRACRPLLAATALTLLCAAAGGTAASLHAATARGGPLPDLAAGYARPEVTVTLTGDPRLARPRPTGAPVPMLLEATVDQVTHQDETTRTRTPVLLIIAEPSPEWAALLPSTRLRLPAVRPAEGHGSTEIVLHVSSSNGTPQVIGGPGTAQRLAGELRSALRDITDPLPADPRGLLPALVVGDTSRVPPDLDDAVRATDMTHLIVVSGAHLVIVLTVLIGRPSSAARSERGGLAGRLGIPLRGTAVLGGVLVLAFVVVCRPDPSVLRAAVCGGIALLAIATGRRRSLLPALAAAVLVLVLYDPRHAHSFGFLLSVLATAALLLIAPGWSAALRRRGLPHRLAEGLAMAAAAQAVCAPVVAVFTGRISVIAIPCNLLAELGFAPAVVLGWIALLLALVLPGAGEAMAWLASWPAWWIGRVARTGAALPGAEAGWPDGWAGAALLTLATLVALAVLRRLAGHPWLAALCVLMLLLAALRPVPVVRLLSGWPPPGWQLVACDVGQGDALVIATAPRQALVIDTGPDPDAIDQCLRELDVRHIPLLVLTHFHADHVAGLPGALRGRRVERIETTTVPAPADQFNRVTATARDAGVPVTGSVPGTTGQAGELVSWQVLWPPAHPAGLDANDASVTLLLHTGDLTIFLPGDLEPAAQRRLLAAHPDLPEVDVLKVPHHGSAYQHPPLLRQLNPRWAVISAGAENSYGHPDPHTVAALTEGGAVVLRTDQHGAVAITSSGAVARHPP